MSADLENVLASVRLRATRRIPAPVNGEALFDYALRCVELGAMLAVEPLAVLATVHHARLTNAAENALLPTPEEPDDDLGQSDDPEV